MQAGGCRSSPRYTRSDRHGLSCFPLPPSKQKLSLLHLTIYFGWRKRRAMCSDGGGGEGSLLPPHAGWSPATVLGAPRMDVAWKLRTGHGGGGLGRTVLTQSSSWVSWTMRCRTSTSPSLWGRQEVIHAPMGAGSASRASPFLLPTLGEDVVLQGPPLCFQGAGRGWLTFPTNPGLGWGWRPETGAW